MDKLVKWLSEYGLLLHIRVYNQPFFVSHAEKDGQVWFDIDPGDETKNQRVTNVKELADFVRSCTQPSPAKDDVILFDVENAIWLELRRLGRL